MAPPSERLVQPVEKSAPLFEPIAPARRRVTRQGPASQPPRLSPGYQSPVSVARLRNKNTVGAQASWWKFTGEKFAVPEKERGRQRPKLRRGIGHTRSFKTFSDP